MPLRIPMAISECLNSSTGSSLTPDSPLFLNLRRMRNDLNNNGNREGYGLEFMDFLMSFKWNRMWKMDHLKHYYRHPIWCIGFQFHPDLYFILFLWYWFHIITIFVEFISGNDSDLLACESGVWPSGFCRRQPKPVGDKRNNLAECQRLQLPGLLLNFSQ